MPEIKKKHPGIKIIVLSGFDREVPRPAYGRIGRGGELHSSAHPDRTEELDGTHHLIMV